MFETWEIVFTLLGAVIVAILSTKGLGVVRDRRLLAMESVCRQLLVNATADVQRTVAEQLSTFPALLNEKMQNQLMQFKQERELKEWIRVDIILHGLSWSKAAHALVLFNFRTHELRPVPEGERWVQAEGYPFAGIPRAVLGSPKWRLLSDTKSNRDSGEIVLLGVVYTWH